MTVSGNRTFKKVIKVKRGDMDGPSSNRASVLIRRGDWDTDTEGRPQEDTGRRWPSISQGEKPQKKLTYQHFDLELIIIRVIRK